MFYAGEEAMNASPESGPIVIIDDDKSICRTLKLHFEREGYDVKTIHNGQDGMDVLESVSSAIVILDLRLPDANGVDLLKKIHDMGKDFYSIIITAFPDMESTVKAVRNGVGEYIYKPIDIQELDRAIEVGGEFLSKYKNHDKSFIPVSHENAFSCQFIGKSHAMRKLFKTIGMVSMSRATVNVTGESGTGKELIAKAIHDNNSNHDEPFISVNCSAIVETLLESELFGHEKGSFTGAINRKEGKFSLARKGTIFLDEIGEMDINLQAKLLRVLQEREFERVGGQEKLKANCRVISATNKDLKQMVKEGLFREDLYYRLNVVSIHVPPLRDRKEDILELTPYFITKARREAEKEISFISQEAMDFLVERNWKGNVRQLENVITSAVVMCRSDRLTKDLFASLMNPHESGAEPDMATTAEPAFATIDENGYLPKSLVEMEKEQIRQALAYTKWHKGKACEILGITRPRLERKLNKYGLKPLKSLYDAVSKTDG